MKRFNEFEHLILVSREFRKRRLDADARLGFLVETKTSAANDHANAASPRPAGGKDLHRQR